MLDMLDRVGERRGLDRSSLARTVMHAYLDDPDADFKRANEVLQQLHEKAAARRAGDPEPTRGPPAQWQARLTVMVDEDLLRRLNERASKQCVTRSALIRRILIKWLLEEDDLF